MGNKKSLFDDPLARLKKKIERQLNGFDGEKYTSNYIAGTDDPQVDEMLHAIAKDMEANATEKQIRAAWAWWYMNCAYIPKESEYLATECLYGDREAIDIAKGTRRPPSYCKDLDHLIECALKSNPKRTAKEVFHELIGKKYGNIIEPLEENEKGLFITYEAIDRSCKDVTVTLKTIQNKITKVKKSLSESR